VDTTAVVVSTGCRQAGTRNHRYRPSSRVAAQTVNATQAAQARCSDGIAAYWSGSGSAALPPPSAAGIVSMNPSPGSSRGGATG
jgi:hypothetical protein